MGMIHFNFRSGALGRFVDVEVALPTDGLAYCEDYVMPGKAPEVMVPGMKFQTVYLISGGGEDATVPFRYMPLERWACENKVMIVCPEVTNSYGLNTQYGINYMTFLTDELPIVIRTMFPSSAAREDNFVMGYGMGGNVALGLAILHPDQYSSCLDIDGGIGFTLDTQKLVEELMGDEFRKHLPLLLTSFPPGESIPGSEYDLYAAAERNLEADIQIPTFFIVAGKRGHVWKRVSRDAEILTSLGYPVRFIMDEDHGHSFEMFGKYMRMGLEELLPLKRAYLYPIEGETAVCGLSVGEAEDPVYTVTRLNDNDYRIQGRKDESMYLLVGNEHALLIDTGMEDSSLMEVLREITEKPVWLALTHGHLDHIGRSLEFDEVYLDDRDREIYVEHTFILSHMSPDCTHNAKPVEEIRHMPEQFHLGGLDVDIVSLQGHTPGTVILVDRKNRCVFTGDAIGSGDGVILAAKGALSVKEFREGLLHAKGELELLGVRDDWKFYGGHSGKEFKSRVADYNPPDMEMLRDMILLCNKVIDGTAELEYQEGSPFDPSVPSVYASYKRAEMQFFR